MSANCATCAFRNVNYSIKGKQQPPCWHPSFVQRPIPDFAGDVRIVYTLDKLATCTRRPRVMTSDFQSAEESGRYAAWRLAQEFPKIYGVWFGFKVEKAVKLSEYGRDLLTEESPL